MSYRRRNNLQFFSKLIRFIGISSLQYELYEVYCAIK